MGVWGERQRERDRQRKRKRRRGVGGGRVGKLYDCSRAFPDKLGTVGTRPIISGGEETIYPGLCACVTRA